MAITPLSKIFTWGNMIARVENRCGNVPEFNMEPQSIIEVAKMRIMAHYTAANAGLRNAYHNADACPVVSGAIDLTAKNYFDVTGVGFGYKQPYLPAKNITHFQKVQMATAFETKINGRYWQLLDGVMMIFQGSGVAAESTLNIFNIRYPVLDVTLADIVANTKMVDLPDWIIPFTTLDIAVECLKEKNLSVPSDMSQGLEGIVAGISDKLAASENAASQMNVDSLRK
jgi:hypothetical protein